MTKKPKKRLTLKQSNFVEEYVKNGGNATQAALVAYDAANKVDAANIGRENLDKPHIKDLIDAKVSDLKDHILDVVKNKDLMGLSLDSAHSDVQDEDPRVREAARKYILEVTKFLSETGKVQNYDNRTQNLVLPKWKGSNKDSK